MAGPGRGSARPTAIHDYFIGFFIDDFIGRPPAACVAERWVFSRRG
ncbi:hypothetical protein NT01EI_3426 [Edwardsiella ictaluri 93-146]|uniref:Uncharacterized protein n=1 Tax=Edwardsiella ictaluri (strain 93-146) TaxID=634503 RepID=C5BBV6_EDWI9|nr:hypothetical protein NT01EI_3426 [Edwardsiella ictaluri 93-146]